MTVENLFKVLPPEIFSPPEIFCDCSSQHLVSPGYELLNNHCATAAEFTDHTFLLPEDEDHSIVEVDLYLVLHPEFGTAPLSTDQASLVFRFHYLLAITSTCLQLQYSL